MNFFGSVKMWTGLCKAVESR